MHVVCAQRARVQLTHAQDHTMPFLQVGAPSLLNQQEGDLTWL